ncbi:MAG: NADH-quinone oxidoreductase subunit C [Ectothiorhodospiraceae bacterium]|jgi:NADH-quinone oxidoreductase subunit C|nr:NADH-quinone oxidoreductase subunit C [Ectothiorhodospiraceae bacterium]
MSQSVETLAEQLRTHLAGRVRSVAVAVGEVTIEVAPSQLLEVATILRDDQVFRFEILVDVCGMDYLEYGAAEWATEEASATGFSRGVEKTNFSRFTFDEPPPARRHEGPRFAAVYHLLSVSLNQRLRIRCRCEDDAFPVLPSVTGIWSSAGWYEREAFDLFGIMFEGHPDLRRILTDYGFIGHPFRKDFPLVGHVEVRYDPEQGRVVYQPVSIEPRVLVPRVIREDHRYLDRTHED